MYRDALLHGRDIEYRELSLEFDPTAHVWNLLADSVTAEPTPSDSTIFSLSAFLDARKVFSGTATELSEALKPYCEETFQPNVLMKKLLRHRQELSEMGIVLETRRTHDRKEISLRRVDCVGNDGKSDTGSVSNLPTQPSQPLQRSS